VRMPGRVFISCGQRTPAEREAAKATKRWFKRRGFEPYVAIQAQTLADVNSGIIDQLRRADFFVFVDFRRERIVRSHKRKPGPHSYRGSLFTNQELAIAYFLQFDTVIFLQQQGVALDGLMQYMGSNAERFSRPEHVVPIVKRLARLWSPSYSRHLALGNTRLSETLMYGDHTGQRLVRTFYVDVHNHRHDVGALDAVARLQHIVHPDGTIHRDIDTSPLKVTGQPGYKQVIWPQSHVAWDSLSVAMDQPSTVYLNSALDVIPRSPLISSPGKYRLAYEVFAQNFPVLKFTVNVSVSDNPEHSSATLVETPPL
jgi:hypothetical protein